jgi:hypothetical protein
MLYDLHKRFLRLKVAQDKLSESEQEGPVQRGATGPLAEMSSRRIKRSAPDLPIHAMLGGESKRDWVYRQLLTAIESGILRAGDTVPSTRALSSRWKVSRGVVELVFEQLAQEGHLHSLPGKGTRIPATSPMEFLQATGLLSDRPSTSSSRSFDDPAWPQAGADTRAAFLQVQPGLPFVARLPDVGLLNLARSLAACAGARGKKAGSAHAVRI